MITRFQYEVTTIEEETESWEEGCTLGQIMRDAERQRLHIQSQYPGSRVRLVQVVMEVMDE